MAFALGAGTGVSTVSIPMRAAFGMKSPPVAPVPVSNQEARLLTGGRRLYQLPPDPSRVWMPRHVEVDDAPALVGHEDHDVDRAQREHARRNASLASFGDR